MNNDSTFTFINRILSLWIKHYYKIITKFTDLVTNIYFDISIKYWAKYTKDVDSEKLKKIIKNFLQYWLENHNIDDFEFNIGSDLKKHIKKSLAK